MNRHESKQIAYRGVDEFSVDNAIAVIRKSILPHINQSIALLRDVTESHGSNITAGCDAFKEFEIYHELNSALKQMKHPVVSS